MRIAIIMIGIAIILLCVQQIAAERRINMIAKIVSKLLHQEEEAKKDDRI